MTEPTDGIVEAPRSLKKGICMAMVSGRGFCPIAMLPALIFQSWPTNMKIDMTTVCGKDVDVGRIQAVKDAIAAGCKYIWFIDDDTVPPRDAGRHLLYLLEQNPKAMVAGGIYTTRSAPPEPIVYLEQGAGSHWDWKVGDKFKCWGIGTGCMMIRLEVFEHLPEPWFLTINDAENKWSDDLHFCNLIAKHTDFEVWAHGGILCHHHDVERGAVYMLPRNSIPYRERSEDFRETEL